MLIFIILMAVIGLICLNVPIAISLALAGVLGLLITEGPSSLVTVALDMYDGSTKFSLIAIPMFVLAGAIMNAGGVTRRLIEFVSALIGAVRGGLAMVSIGVSLFFAEISGSAVADVAALGSIMIPEMKKRGYGAPFAAAGHIIIGIACHHYSAINSNDPLCRYRPTRRLNSYLSLALFQGLMGAIGLMGVSWWFARRYNLPVEEAFNWPRLRHAAIEAGPTFLLPIIILGGIFGGFVTATEAAGLAVLAAIGVGIWYREVDFRQLHRAMLEGGMQTAVVMVLVAASVLMGGFLTRAQIPQELAAQMVAFTDSKYVILLILNVFFLIIGFFLHSAAAIILVVPIVVPLIQQVGIDPVHFGLGRDAEIWRLASKRHQWPRF
jgi:TRAP-type C4-dicarboxylate transport system permease large subunit